MIVCRIETDRGSHVEPPLDPTWSDFQKLEWHAAVVEHDTGLHVRVLEGGSRRLEPARFGRPERWVDIPGSYSIQVEHSSSGSFPYTDAWVYLNGVNAGATQARRKDDR